MTGTGTLQGQLAATPASDRPTRVLFLAERFWPELTGCGPIILNMARGLRSEGFDVVVLTTRPHFPERRVWAEYASGAHDRQSVDDIEVIRIPFYPFLRGSLADRFVTESLMAASFLWNIMLGRVGKFDVVVSLCPSIFTTLCACLVARSRRHLAVVHDIQSGFATGLDMGSFGAATKLLKWLERTCLNKADVVFVLSNAMEAALRRNSVHTPIVIMPPQIDIDAIAPKALQPECRSTVVYSGNLGRKQGLEQVLQMAYVLKGIRPEIKVMIRGAGNQSTDLRHMAAQMRLDNLAFEPLLPTSQLNTAMASAAVHLVPQRPEASDSAIPSKLYSIMAAARPAICTALPGSALHELMTECGGFICVPPDDAAALAAEVIRLVDDRKLGEQMGQRGRSYVKQQFDGRLGLKLLAKAAHSMVVTNHSADKRKTVIVTSLPADEHSGGAHLSRL